MVASGVTLTQNQATEIQQKNSNVSKTIQLKIEFNNGYFRMYVRSDTAIKYLKWQIEDQHGIPSDFQKLCYLGRELENQSLFSDYSITHDTTIDLVPVRRRVR